MNKLVKPGDIVTGVQVIKSDNCGDDSGVEGYDVTIQIGELKCVDYIAYSMDGLEDSPYGIYDYDGEKFNQVENWQY